MDDASGVLGAMRKFREENKNHLSQTLEDTRVSSGGSEEEAIAFSIKQAALIQEEDKAGPPDYNHLAAPSAALVGQISDQGTDQVWMTNESSPMPLRMRSGLDQCAHYVSP